VRIKMATPPDPSDYLLPVIRFRDLPPHALDQLVRLRGLTIAVVTDGADIPGSYWGPPEAGIIGSNLYARGDTPVHSVLHTACHWICMDATRRLSLHTNAGGDDLEEAAVCYLQCVLADELTGYSRDRAFIDMDTWGYSFRMGSTRRWFEEDAQDAHDWLRQRGLITS
jgi:hypothetical protein